MDYNKRINNFFNENLNLNINIKNDGIIILNKMI